MTRLNGISPGDAMVFKAKVFLPHGHVNFDIELKGDAKNGKSISLSS